MDVPMRAYPLCNLTRGYAVNLPSVPHKLCSKCTNTLPLALFGSNKSNKDGLAAWCKRCKRDYDAAYFEQNRERILSSQATKYQRDKGKRQSRDKDYYKRNGEKIRSRVRSRYHAKAADLLIARKQQRQENPKKYRADDKRRRMENPEKYRARSRNYYLKNADELCRKTSLYQQKNKAKVNQYKSAWAKRNRDRVRVILTNNRARRRGAKGKFTKAQLTAKYSFHGWMCYLCGIGLTSETVQPDHRKPISRGGTNWIANIAPSCARCNRRKNGRTEIEYRKWLAENKDVLPAIVSERTCPQMS
jgi:hypothetical protein